MEDLRIIISGCHSGPNPSAGLGLANSLRAAFPRAKLEARDLSVSSSGIHAEVFDDVWICPPWDDLNLSFHSRQILSRLEPNTFFLSSLDLEIRWLSTHNHPRLLLPASDALEASSKPHFSGASDLCLQVPPSISTEESDKSIEKFCRRFGWPVWVKGPEYDARIATNWQQLQNAKGDLAETWGGDGLFVQADVPGHEMSFVFCAWRGELLDAVRMEKRLVTDEGKTWGGSVFDLGAEWLERLRTFAEKTRWSGGCELECIRDNRETLWLIDCNPRFPAWIHGATLAGNNLPGKLLTAASGLPHECNKSPTSDFVRVVTEVPQRNSHPLQPLSHSMNGDAVSSKHPSGMPRLRRRLRCSSASAPLADHLTDAEKTDLLAAANDVSKTPVRFPMRATAEKVFSESVKAATAVSGTDIDVKLAYSIKTNPSRLLMTTALRHGMLAEAISPAEVDWAIENGFYHSQIIYNGPQPFIATDSDRNILAAFADSLDVFELYLSRSVARTIGIRIRVPGVESRFGVSLLDYPEFIRLIHILRRTDPSQSIGFSFHAQSSAIGLTRWSNAIKALRACVCEVAAQTGRTMALIDLGGGWAPEDTQHIFTEALPSVTASLAELTSCLVLEPGKSLAQVTETILASVLEIREVGEDVRELIIDAGLCDIPLAHVTPHRFAHIDGETIRVLPRGEGRILGRLCMEHDVLLSDCAIPRTIRPGDVIAICDVGGYDSSMSYEFGLGG